MNNAIGGIETMRERTAKRKNADEPDEQWLPASEVRRIFGISRTTEWRWTRDGILSEPARIAGRKYYPRSAIDDLKRRALQPGGVSGAGDRA